MERLTEDQLLRLVDVLQDVHSVRELDEFPSAVMAALSRLVPNDITSYNEINVDTAQNVVLASPPFYDSVPGILESFNSHVGEHPLIAHYGATRDGRALRISDFLSQRQFHDLGLYADFYRVVGVERQMAVTLPSLPDLVIGIALNRGGVDFDERERMLLDILRPHLALAYRNAEAVTLMRRAVEESGRQALAVSADGRVRSGTSRAQQLLVTYFGPGDADRLPPPVQAWFQVQRQALSGATDPTAPPEWLVVEGEAGRLIIRLLSGGNTGLENVLLLEEQRAGPSLQHFMRLGLTRREAEVLFLVVQGKTNSEIAQVLSLSPRTVQSHLEHVYGKLRVQGRVAATALVLQSA